MKKIIYVIMLSFIMINFAKADEISRAIKIECIPEIGYLSIKQRAFEGWPLPKNFEKQAVEIYKKYGIMYLPKMVERNKENKVLSESPILQSCQLGDKVFDITISPVVNEDDELCYSYYSIGVSIVVNKKPIMDNFLFEKCYSEKEYANEIIINNDKYGYIGIRGYKIYHGWYKNKNFTPITDKTYYSENWFKLY